MRPEQARHRDPRRRRTTRVAAILAAVLGLAAACSTNGAATTAGPGAAAGPTGSVAATGPSAPAGTVAPAPHGPYPVLRRTVTFVDTSRPTEAGAQTPAHPERTLETHLFVPDGPGPFPLIVFSHGLSGHPTKFSHLLTAWATAGFVVAAPAFPLTNDTVPASSKNWTGLGAQPGDVSFVIDRMIAADHDPADPLAGRIDTDRIGAGGLSLGGATTYGVTFHDCCRDRRIKAAEVLSGARLPVSGTGEFVLDGHVPLLVMHGDQDLALPYASEVETFQLARPPVWFVTLIGGSHAPPFEDAESPWDALDEQTTTDFWSGTLGGDPAALARVTTDATVPGLASIQQK